MKFQPVKMCSVVITRTCVDSTCVEGTVLYFHCNYYVCVCVCVYIDVHTRVYSFWLELSCRLKTVLAKSMALHNITPVMTDTGVAPTHSVQ